MGLIYFLQPAILCLAANLTHFKGSATCEMDSSTVVIIFLALLAALFLCACLFCYCRGEPIKTRASSGSIPREELKVSKPPKNDVEVDQPELYDEVSFIIEDGHQSTVFIFIY